MLQKIIASYLASSKELENYIKEVDKKLGDNNAKFTGFLMMGMEGIPE